MHTVITVIDNKNEKQKKTKKEVRVRLDHMQWFHSRI